MSNEISQELPLPDDVKAKIKVMYQATDIDVFKLAPSMAISNKIKQINEELMIMYEYETIQKRKHQEYQMIMDKEEQIQEIANVQSWSQKEALVQ